MGSALCCHEQLYYYEAIDPSTLLLTRHGPFLGEEQTLLRKIQISQQNYTQLSKELRAKGQKWTDPSFPPRQESIGDKVRRLSWARISEFVPGAKFKVNEIELEDILQGDIGDCYLLSAVGALAEVPHRIDHVFLDLDDHHDTGLYAVRFRRAGVYQEVCVDDYVPVTASMQAAFVKPHREEYWPLIVEKAWAKICGSYQKMIGGYPREALSAMTVAPSFSFNIQASCYSQDKAKAHKLWQDLIKIESQKWAACAGTVQTKEIEQLGLVKGHAYTVVGAFQITRAGSQCKLVKLRNPWGRREWKGSCRDDDFYFWNGVNKADKHRVGYQQKDDGIFFMQYSDFLDCFDLLDICKLNDRFCYTFMEQPSSSKRASFTRLQTKGGKVYFGLHQNDLRGEGSDSQGDLSRATIIVGKLNSTSTEWVCGISSKLYADLYLEADLPTGSYLVYTKVECTSQQMKPVLSVYSQRLAQLSKVEGKVNGFLQQVFLDYARKDSSQFKVVKQNGYVMMKLLYQSTGFGVIAIEAYSGSIQIRFDQAQFTKSGFKLKKPNKARGSQSIVARRGKPALVIAKVDSRRQAEAIEFPPKMQILEYE